MSTFMEGRASESPYIKHIWRGHIGKNYAPVCPADANWNLLFVRHGSKLRVTAEGATTHFVPKTQPEGMEFLVIKFNHGVYMPHIPADTLVNVDVILPNASGDNFSIQGKAWQFPDYDNVEIFVEWMVREGALLIEPIVDAARQNQPVDVSSRTVRRRFLHTTGLTPKTIQQIRRANQAAEMLGQGVPILDTVYQLGYSDQPHLTRSLKRFCGQTPAEIVSLTNAST